MTPDNLVFSKENSHYFVPCGHGDVVPALKESGVLPNFISSGGKYIYIVNVDNVLAELDHRILDNHIQANAPVTCEVVKATSADTGGFLCDVAGFRQVVEKFRIDKFDESCATYLSTNSMIVNANLDFDVINWSWHRVKKTFEGNLTVHYERLLQDLTANFKTNFLEVSREDRFMPVKTISDLENVKL